MWSVVALKSSLAQQQRPMQRAHQRQKTQFNRWTFNPGMAATGEVQSWPKKVVLGCVILPLFTQPRTHFFGHLCTYSVLSSTSSSILPPVGQLPLLPLPCIAFSPIMVKGNCNGASIYDVHSRWGGGVSPKSRRKEQHQLICDGDKDGRGKKIRNLCRCHIWKPPNLRRRFCPA